MQAQEIKDILEIATKRADRGSELTEEQVKHFKNKGKFSAIYKPYRTDDLCGSLRGMDGKSVVIYCNYETVPCIDAPRFFGQYKFFIEGLESRGWITEMEFENIKIIDEFADCNTWNCDHQYLTVINNREIAKKELGKWGELCELPSILGRVYGSKQHEYVKKIANFDKVFYKYKDEKWKII